MAEKDSIESTQNKENLDSTEGKKSPTEEENIVEGMPAEMKRIMRASLFMGNMANPMLEKITPEHITQVLKISDKQEDNSHSEYKTDKRYTFLYFIVGAAIFVFLIYFLIDRDKDLLLKLISYLVAFAGGFGVGRIPRKKEQGESE